MRSSVILFVASLLIPLSAAAVNVANPDCIRSRDDPSWESNCSPEDQNSCRYACEGKVLLQTHSLTTTLECLRGV
ncbi:hypothetical protein C8034_v000655 [Colletotrichum sidae]|uniref:Extracellular membrane protein CFEM domain-containing protein n=2 Tax=Colletotrichum orbiculare species complex TaxID=2707354 RepID=A0A4R8R4R1_COLTR|nr:hypothetical protein CTRI78_v008072 [Colletotrichum trifolii]TEA16965.1 hypothetical protein C8034_v000655 [Colletotrichum sidae]